MKPYILWLISFLEFWKFSTETFQCGTPSTAINEVIVRGHDVSPGTFPWHAALYHRNATSTDDYKCGGTLISPTFVLTVDHCIKNTKGQVLSPESIVIRLGVYNLNDLETSQRHEILEIHRYTESKWIRKDIALLELNSTAVFNKFVQPACINQVEDITGQYGVAVGWGYTEDDQVSPKLKATQMPVLRATTCMGHESIFRLALDDSLFCAGYTNGTNVCNGDSGGGLHVKRGGRWYVAGIISFTAMRDGFRTLCRTDSYSAFTNVATFVPWIQNITEVLSFYSDVKTAIRHGKMPDPTQQYRNYLPRNCGVSLVNRIVGGTRANLFEFPWMALLAYKIDIGTISYENCGGSLINKRYVLTAAQCRQNLYHDPPFQVRLGEYDRSRIVDCNPNDDSDCAPPVQDVDIEAFIVHPKHSFRWKLNDIALVRLVREIAFDDHIQPVCLPVTETLRKQMLQQYIIIGFGSTAPAGEQSNILMKATVSAVTLDECKKHYAEYRRIKIEESQICAGRGKNTNDTCSGDSGSPLGYPVRYNGMRFVQFGITSFGIMGCSIPPSVFTNVAHFIDWIKVNMEA